MNLSVELISSCDSTNEMDLLLKRVAACEGQKKMKFTKKVLKGLGSGICIASIVASWVIMAEKLQDLGSSYSKPFFQTYWIHSFYSVMYIFWKLWLVFPGHCSCNKVGEGTLTNFKMLAISSTALCLVLYSSKIFWLASLTLTSVSANTAIYQSSSALVFIISVPLLRERVTLLKIASVTVTVIGVCVVSLLGNYHGRSLEVPYNDRQGLNLTNVFAAQEQSTPLGYVYVLLSTVLYAVYETFYKRFGTREDDTAPVFNGIRVLGYMGVISLCSWPLLVIVHFTGIERFELPTLQALYLLFAMALLDLIFNAALVICIAISSPLFASVGSVLTIPVSVLLDWLLKDYILSWQSFLGVGVIVIGFFGLVASEYWDMKRSDAAIETNNSSKSVQKSSGSSNTKISFRSRLLQFLI